MVELQWNNGDLVPDGTGDFCRLEGSEALVQRVLFQLSVRKGSFPFLPRLGSRLHTLAAEKPSARQRLCEQYVRQALEEEDVTVTDVVYRELDGQAQVRVLLQWQGQALEATARIGGIADENG